MRIAITGFALVLTACGHKQPVINEYHLKTIHVLHANEIVCPTLKDIESARIVLRVVDKNGGDTSIRNRWINNSKCDLVPQDTILRSDRLHYQMIDGRTYYKSGGIYMTEMEDEVVVDQVK